MIPNTAVSGSLKRKKHFGKSLFEFYTSSPPLTVMLGMLPLSAVAGRVSGRAACTSWRNVGRWRRWHPNGAQGKDRGVGVGWCGKGDFGFETSGVKQSRLWWYWNNAWNNWYWQMLRNQNMNENCIIFFLLAWFYDHVVEISIEHQKWVAHDSFTEKQWSMQSSRTPGWVLFLLILYGKQSIFHP